MSDEPDYDDGGDAQSAWVRFAEAVRLALEGKVQDLKAMNAPSASEFVTACREAMQLELEARSFVCRLEEVKYGQGGESE